MATATVGPALRRRHGVRPLLAALLVALLPAAGRAAIEFKSSFAPEPGSEAARAATGGGAAVLGLLPSTAMMASPSDEHSLHEAEHAQDIVSSFVQAFLNRQGLEQSELDCLSAQTGQAAGNVMIMSSNAVSLVEKVMGKHISVKGLPSHAAPQKKVSGLVDSVAGSIASEVDAIGSHAVGKAGSQSVETLNLFYGERRRLQEGSASSVASSPFLMLEVGASMKQLLDAMRQVAKECLRSDGQQSFERAALHMQSLSYMSGHLVANGADVVTEIADAAVAFRQHDHEKFGHDLGVALRKVVLTHSTDASLPEGLPDKKTLANISEGLLRGFFGSGSELDMRLKHDPEVVRIDLHQCVGDNLEFFQDIWKKSMYFFAQRAMQNPLAAKSEDEKVEWGSALAYDMLELPEALRKCDLTVEQEEMLMDSIKALGNGVQLHVQMPGADESSDAVADEMARSVKDWAHTRWYDFGSDLGKMLQGLTTTVYAQKYSLDAHGVLRKNLLQDLAMAGSGGQSGRLPTAFLALAALVAPALLVVRRLRQQRHDYQPAFLVTSAEVAGSMV
mmetsp:Transcript_34193/g.86490  ORF Transcript_34193/g.86490 Transcript_34193/m.86490 type:complete len:561 (-) Transcript_34193:74-1756(-)